MDGDLNATWEPPMMCEGGFLACGSGTELALFRGE